MSPDYIGVELGIGESLLLKAIGESTGRSLSLVKADLKKEGDLGLVAMVSTEKLTFGSRLISLIELKKQPKDYFQAKTSHSSIRVQ